ncbi:hypothetical protein ACJJTC_000518 [Scirpophaga incertulas]
MTPLPAPPARLRRRDACDASAGIVTTIRDTVSTCSWIFYSNSSGSTAGEGAAPPPGEPDPALDSMHLMLDPHLRPISPDPNSEESKRIYEEHKQLAPEYLKVQTETAYLSKHKSELEEQMDEDELRQKREIIQLEKEKDSLIKLYFSLKKQLSRAENDCWLPDDVRRE